MSRLFEKKKEDDLIKEKKSVTVEEAKEAKNYETEDENIPYIPEIQDIDSDQLNVSIETSKVMLKQMINLQDLEKDVNKHFPFTTINGVDITLLTKQLISYNQIKEDDIHWTWDNILSDVGSSWSKMVNN